MDKGQMAMEYFVSYGWAFMLVATFFGLLTFIYSTPTDEVRCSSSDPARLEVKSLNIPGYASPNNQIVLGNSGSEKTSITGIALDSAGYIEDSGIASLNDTLIAYVSQRTPIKIAAGGTATLKNFTISPEKPGQGKIIITYKNQSGIAGTVEISCRGTPPN